MRNAENEHITSPDIVVPDWIVDQQDLGNHREVHPVRMHLTPVTYYPGQIVPGEDNPVPNDAHPQVRMEIQHYHQPLSMSEMRTIMKEVPDPVKEGQEFISFFEETGSISGFHAGDYVHVVHLLLPRAMCKVLLFFS